MTASNQMQALFYISEIMELILDYLKISDLRHLAVTCRSLLEPALDRIWQNGPPTLRHLFNLWPDAAVTRHASVWIREDMSVRRGWSVFELG